MLNIAEDLIFTNQDVTMNKQNLRFCFTIISPLQIQYHTTVCGPGSTASPVPKSISGKPTSFHETLCVCYKLFLKDGSLLGYNTVTLGK
jgi:hypothetical protein